MNRFNLIQFTISTESEKMIGTIDVIVGIIKVKEMLTLESEFNLKSQNDMYELMLKSQSWKTYKK